MKKNSKFRNIKIDKKIIYLPSICHQYLCKPFSSLSLSHSLKPLKTKHSYFFLDFRAIKMKITEREKQIWRL